MNTYDEIYSIAFSQDLNRFPSLSPANESTADRPYGRKMLVPGAPLFFENGFRDEFKASGIKEETADILFCGVDLVVTERTKAIFELNDIQGLQLYPAVYIDDSGRYHDNYWFLNFYERLDCWHRQRSVYDPSDLIDPDDRADIMKYSLDENVLDRIEEEARLLFKMGMTAISNVFIHADVVRQMVDQKMTGAKFIKVADYEEGMEY